jgi:hypothetical protein
LGSSRGISSLFSASPCFSLSGGCSRRSCRGSTEASVKAEYATVYEILDYAVDGGFQLLDESNTILALLTRPPTDYAKGIRQQPDLPRPWTVEVSHSDHESLVDAIETIQVTVTQFGGLELSHIRGSLNVTSHLSGTPAWGLVLTPSSL